MQPAKPLTCDELLASAERLGDFARELLRQALNHTKRAQGREDRAATSKGGRQRKLYRLAARSRYTSCGLTRQAMAVQELVWQMRATVDQPVGNLLTFQERGVVTNYYNSAFEPIGKLVAK